MIGIPQAGDTIGPYEVVRELGRGGMALVLEVIDGRDGVHRALKLMLPGVRGEEVARRFRREFRALSRLDHPNVLRVFEGGLQDGRPYFAMELLAGRELGEEVESWRALAPADRFKRAGEVLVQVARALEYIHSHGLVHRDVTPSNIMMQPDGTARLMDFGVVKEPGGDLTTVGEVVGTVAYIAPEQIHGGRVDARADLYSLGAVLYLMLTGRRPFNARTLAGYMDKHLHRPVRPPRELAPTVPTWADEVCVRLLAKKPAERFASATHLLHVLHAADKPVSSHGRTGWVPALVGRAGEVAHARELLARMVTQPGEESGAAPRGGVLVIEASAGMGRGRMADEVSVHARRVGLPVSRTRNQVPGQRAFEGLRSVFDDLVGDEEHVSPVLAATFGHRGAKDVRMERWAVMSELGNLLALGGPRVIILDELDQADRATIEAAEYLVRNLIAAEPRPLLLVYTRSPAVPGVPDPLAGLQSGDSTGIGAERIALGPLPTPAVEELLLAVMADAPATRVLARRLHEVGEGNPFFINEMIKGLVEQGVLQLGVRSGRGGLNLTVEQVEKLQLPVPRSLREAILEVFQPLSLAGRRVGLALAVARTELDLDTIIEVTALPEEAVLKAVDELLEERLIRERRVRGLERFELAHNRLRDVALEETPEEMRKACHRRLGSCLERRHSRAADAVVEALAYHFVEGDLPAKAYPYLVRAAAKLRRRTFVAEALSCLDRALVIEPAAREYMTIDDADRRLVEARLARASALLHLGRWEEGDAEARAADALAVDLGDSRLQAMTAIELAVQNRRVRQLDNAEAQLRRALQLAEGLGDKRLQILPLYEFGAVQWSRGDLEAARDYFVQALAGSEAYDDEGSLALGYNGLGLIALCRGQSAEARRYFEQSIAVCEQYGLMDRLSISRTNLIEVYHLTGNLRRGLDLADRAVAHAREVHHLYGLGLGLRYRVLMLTDLGRLVEAIAHAEEALRIQRGLGNGEETLNALIVLVRALLSNGDATAGEARLREAVVLLDAYDTEGFAPLVYAWMARLYAQRGDMVGAGEALARAISAEGRGWPHQQARLELNLTRVHEVMGNKERALEHANEALRVADASGYRYYAMRARQSAARLEVDELAAARHQRVGDALARSLAASLPREDRERFLALQGVKRRVLRSS